MSERRQHQGPGTAHTIRMLLATSITLVVAVVLWLRSNPAPAPTGSQAQTVLADDVGVTLRLDGATVGPCRIEVLTRDAAGQPVDASAVRLRFTMTEMEMRATEVEARPMGRGHFQAQGSF